MDDLWRRTLSRKYASVLDRMETALRTCPPELWESSVWPVSKEQAYVWPIRRFGHKGWPTVAEQERLLPTISAFWNVAYHAVFHLDFYLSGGGLPYRPPAPFREEEHRPNTVPARTYTASELLGYLAHVRVKARETIAQLTDDRAAEVLPRSGGAFLDLLFRSLLHAQEHEAQLSLVLGQHGVSPGGGEAVQQAQLLRDNVRQRTDEELDAWVEAMGGYERLLPRVVAGFASRLRPASSGVLVLETGRPFAIRLTPGAARVEKSLADRADVTVRLSPQDFLRWAVRELALDAGRADGRIRVEGDASLVTEGASGL